MSLHFWREMQYRCTRCGVDLVMALEDGCEGPPGGREVEFTFGPGHPVAGQKGLMRFTPGGRVIQPVPFGIACRCGQHGAYKAHVNWGADRTINVTVADGAEPDFPHFRYDAREDPQACGQPRGHLLIWD